MLWVLVMFLRRWQFSPLSDRKAIRVLSVTFNEDVRCYRIFVLVTRCLDHNLSHMKHLIWLSPPDSYGI
jgi:hypothetical protein